MMREKRMPYANSIWSVGRRNRNEDFEMSADDRNCTGHFGVDAFCLALHGADLHIRSGAWSVSYTHLDVYKRQTLKFMHRRNISHGRIMMPQGIVQIL